MALTIVELSGLVCESDSVENRFVVDDENLDAVLDTLHSEGIFMFDVEEAEDGEVEGDDGMDGDHGSALASAGFGTDEDYGGGDERL